MPTLITQGGYATGDQFSIATVLMHDPGAYVALSCLSAPRDDQKDHSGSIQSFYRECGIAAERIIPVPLEDLSNKFTLDKKAVELTKKDPRFKNYEVKSVSAGTEYVAEKWGRETQLGKDPILNCVRQAWGIHSHVPNLSAEQQDQGRQTRYDNLKVWLGNQGVEVEKLKDQKVAVLWSRFSGKGGEAHPEHDTSHAGMEQTINSLKEAGFGTIIIAGDRHPFQPKKPDDQAGPAPKNRYGEFVEASKNSPCNVVDLTEFWKDDGGQKTGIETWGGDNRAGQFALYDCLNAESGAFVHIGPRSGNLEAMALMGHSVGYLEQSHSSGGPRMDTWSNAPGLAYQKILLEELPTRTGKFLAAQVTSYISASGDGYQQHVLPEPGHLPSKEINRPVTDRREEHQKLKDPGIREKHPHAGYLPSDLAAITSFARINTTQQQIAKLGPQPGQEQLQPLQNELAIALKENIAANQERLGRLETKLERHFGGGDELRKALDHIATDERARQAAERPQKEAEAALKNIDASIAKIDRDTATKNEVVKKLEAANKDASKLETQIRELGENRAQFMENRNQAAARLQNITAAVQTAQDRLDNTRYGKEEGLNRHEVRDLAWGLQHAEALDQKLRLDLAQVNDALSAGQQHDHAPGQHPEGPHPDPDADGQRPAPPQADLDPAPELNNEEVVHQRPRSNSLRELRQREAEEAAEKKTVSRPRSNSVGSSYQRKEQEADGVGIGVG